MSRGRYYERKDKKEFVVRNLTIVFALVIAAVVIFSVIWKVFSKDREDYAAEATTEEGLVTIDGKKYRPKTGIRTYLYIGDDSRGKQEADKARTDGRGIGDVFQLLVVDRVAKTYVRIPINRNTMCDVNLVDEENGTVIFTYPAQLCISYRGSFGPELSCKNASDAVSGIFHGAKIDEYASLNMDSIGILNHMAGGVTITMDEDLTAADPAFVKGQTVTLTDQQAEAYVRARMSVSDGTNESRMGRQENFLAALKENYKAKMAEDEEFAIDVYKAVEDYMVTSLSMGDVSRLAKVFMDSEDLGIREITGKPGEDEEGYATFEADQTSIDEICKEFLFEEAY